MLQNIKAISTIISAYIFRTKRFEIHHMDGKEAIRAENRILIIICDLIYLTIKSTARFTLQKAQTLMVFAVIAASAYYLPMMLLADYGVASFLLNQAAIILANGYISGFCTNLIRTIYAGHPISTDLIPGFWAAIEGGAKNYYLSCPKPFKIGLLNIREIIDVYGLRFINYCKLYCQLTASLLVLVTIMPPIIRFTGWLFDQIDIKEPLEKNILTPIFNNLAKLQLYEPHIMLASLTIRSIYFSKGSNFIEKMQETTQDLKEILFEGLIFSINFNKLFAKLFSSAENPQANLSLKDKIKEAIGPNLAKNIMLNGVGLAEFVERAQTSRGYYPPLLTYRELVTSTIKATARLSELNRK